MDLKAKQLEEDKVAANQKFIGLEREVKVYMEARDVALKKLEKQVDIA